jgi:hypothetical protein
MIRIQQKKSFFHFFNEVIFLKVMRFMRMFPEVEKEHRLEGQTCDFKF